MGHSLVIDSMPHEAAAHIAEDLRGRTVFLVGDYLRTHLAGLTRALLDQHGAARVVLLTESDETAQEMLAAMPEDCAAGRLRALASHSGLERAFSLARARFGDPRLVVSTPFRPLPRRAPGRAEEPQIEPAEVEETVAQHVTHHARVAQLASQVEGARLTVVSCGAPAGEGRAAALAFTARTMLRAFTSSWSAGAAQSGRGLLARQVELMSPADPDQPVSVQEAAAAVRSFCTAALLTGGASDADRVWHLRGTAMSA